MAFVKLKKNKAYFMRFQTKYRRRRECKTDYYARKRLITQDKDKFNTPKYRLVSRVTCHRIIAQVIYATLQGDKIFCSADSYDLKKYGLTAGLSNYAAGYATGLLLAKRLLKKTEMDQIYTGVQQADGQDYDVSKNSQDRRPFKCILDIGLHNATTGNRIFSVLKGACDGGLYIPHSHKRFPGYKQKKGQKVYDAKIHRERIFGIHVDKYMKKLKNDSQKFEKQFNKVNECLEKNGVNSIQELFKKIHKAIRENPDKEKVQKKDNFKRDHKKYRSKKINKQEKKKRIKQKIELFLRPKKQKKDKKEKKEKQ